MGSKQRNTCFLICRLTPNASRLTTSFQQRIDELLRVEWLQIVDGLPHTNEAQRIYGDDPRLTLAGTPMAALRDADALIIVTEWKVFRSPDFAAIKSGLKHITIGTTKKTQAPAS